MRDFLHRLHLRVWFSLYMMEAYLAYHRGEMVYCAECENLANRCEMELQRLEVLK